MIRSMIKYLAVLTIITSVISCDSDKTIEIGTLSVIPKPAEMVAGEGHFTFDKHTTVAVENEEQAITAKLFFRAFEVVSGWQPSINIGGKGQITFSTDVSLKEEAYLMEITEKSIEIKASSGAGFFYALQSLKQLLPPSFYSGTLQPEVAWGVPSVTVKDDPAFGWRGYMLDVSRHFFEVDQVKEVIDFMAELKLNRFHWHLVDDQGWRLEIKNYPKLTEVGAWRMDFTNTDETVSNWFGRPVQLPSDTPTYGGFYTQEEVREIIDYAKNRYIEIIPEIDMPGHAQATIAAYPEIGCVNAEPYVATGGVVRNNTYNPGKEETFEFAENMLNEVMDLFPFKYVHIGGDECNKSQWLDDPYAQSRMKEEGLADVYELQSYFIKRIEKIINARDRVMVGWDEILEGGLAPNATVMSWRGEAGGIESAKAGHEVIMTPSEYCYVDLKQGHDDLEPNLGYSQLLLSTAYSYQVIPESLNEEEGELIKGIQANLWTESITDWSKLTYMTFPRLFAVAENGWTEQENKDWDDFTDRLQMQLKRLDVLDVRYAVSAFSPWISHMGVPGGVEIELKTEVNNLDIYYTLDGTEPTLQSTNYQGAFTLRESSTINARAFRLGEAVGYVSELEFPVHKAFGKGVGKAAKLTDHNYGKLNLSDENWLSFSEGLEAEIAFDQLTEVSEVSLNALRFTITAIYPPEKIEVFGSTDGKQFTKLGEMEQQDLSHVQGRNKIPTTISFDPTQVKVLRIRGKEVNPIPEGHHTAGSRSKIFIDEIVVN